MIESLRPLGDRVLVKRKDMDDLSAGGIVLPDSAKKKQQIGTVLAVAPGKRNDKGNLIPNQLKVGDQIYFNVYSGIEIKEGFLVLSESEVLGTFGD